MSLDFKAAGQLTTKADFTYSIAPDSISITNTTNGRASVKNDIEAVLSKIEYWHQGSIAGLKIMYRGERGVWCGVRWGGQRAAFLVDGREECSGEAAARGTRKR
jgi:hypothetical protein